MTDREVKSLVKQLGYVYCINKRSSEPANLCIAGITPKIKSLLVKNNYDNWRLSYSEESYMKLYPKEELIYLTADGTELAETLDPSKVYIIGGIVDRNRHKFITFKKAIEQGIRTAKLPLDKYIDTKATKVLTVNHTFSCLIKFMETHDWSKAFIETLPMRKHVIALDENDKKRINPEDIIVNDKEKNSDNDDIKKDNIEENPE